MSSKSSRKGDKPEKGAKSRATQQRIIDAFERVLLRDGVAGVGINAIVAEAGVGKGLIYQNPFIIWFNHNYEPGYSGETFETPDGAIVVGGGLFSIGAVFYALHRPNPWPRWFGYHEIFHLFVIAGVAVHYVAVAFFAVPQATA